MWDADYRHWAVSSRDHGTWDPTAEETKSKEIQGLILTPYRKRTNITYKNHSLVKNLVVSSTATTSSSSSPLNDTSTRHALHRLLPRTPRSVMLGVTSESTHRGGRERVGYRQVLAVIDFGCCGPRREGQAHP